MEFQNKLKALRTGRGVSQQSLADAIYVSRSAVAKWESGLGYPSRDSLEALSAYFGVDADYFRTEEPEKVIIRKNSRIRILLAALALAGILVLAGALVLMHSWFSSAAETDTEKLARQAANYLGYENLEIVKTAKRGDFMAALCQSSEGQWCLCIYQRDRLFQDRWEATGGKWSTPAGELSSWNYGSPQDGAVLVFCGGGLSEDICWYTFVNGGIIYTCPVEGGMVLDIFLIPGQYDIGGAPQPLDENKEPIH